MLIRVVVRKRPLSKHELSKGEKDVLEVRPNGLLLVHEPKTKVDLTKIVETQGFQFDDTFEYQESNEMIYGRIITPLVNFIFEGGKASCFAYGQTGSGKTFSMMGCRPDAPREVTHNAGLYALASRDIFHRITNYRGYSHLQVYISCFEIYGSKLFDLLNQKNQVRCLEDAKQQVQILGLTEHLVKSANELLDMMSAAQHLRSTGSTGANAESSRSHQILQIVIKDPTAVAKNKQKAAHFSINNAANNIQSKGIERKLSFIDLAGSERAADTNHSSKQTRMEGAEINTSLLALKEVIRSLEKKQGSDAFIPFRGSKLTQVLKDSFVGSRTRTCMLTCVSPSHLDCEHTLNTLRYANRVKEQHIGGSGLAPPPSNPPIEEPASFNNNNAEPASNSPPYEYYSDNNKRRSASSMRPTKQQAPPSNNAIDNGYGNGNNNANANANANLGSKRRSAMPESKRKSVGTESAQEKR